MSFENKISKFYQELQLHSQLSYRHFREDSWKAFLEVGLPIKTEDWKYTNLAPLNELNFNGGLAEINLAQFVKENILLANYLVVVDGRVNLELSNLPKDNLLEIKLLEKNSEQESVNTNTLGSLQKFAPADFQSLNSALFEDAVILTFKQGFSLDAGLQVINISTANFSAPRIFYKLNTGVALEIVESYFSIGEDLRLVCPVAEYFLDQNAELKVYKIISEAKNTYHISNQISQLAKDSRFFCYTFNLNNGVTRNNLLSRLVGTGAFSSLIGLNVVGNQEHVDNFTVLDHVAPHCESYELYKSVLGQQAKTAFNGTIIVQQDAQKTNAIQSNQSLLLSAEAQSFAKPQLKIWADDVKCTHGATFGNLDTDALFYLRSRGLAESEARRLLVEAFAGEVTAQVKNLVVRSFLEKKIFQKLVDIF